MPIRLDFSDTMARSPILLVALVVAILSISCSGRPASSGRCSVEHDVAIIGAGVSGSYSAYKLRNDGLDIGLYEYSDRIGGRFYTESLPDVPDQNLELGGMRLVDGLHVLLQNLIAELNLTQTIFKYGNDTTYPSRVFRRNVSMTTEEFATGDIPYNLTAEEKANQADLLGYLFRKLTNNSLDNVTETNVFDLTVPDGRKLYNLSVPESLSLVASSEAMSYLLTGNHFNHPEVSAADMVYYYFGSHRHQTEGADILTAEEGYSQIVNTTVYRFLEASLSHSIEMNMKLEAIRGTPGRYFLRFRRTVTIDDETHDLHNRGATTVVCANKVILGLSKFGLSQIKWKHLNSRRYQDVMAGTFVVHASKVFLTYDSPWWIEESKYPTRDLEATGLGEVYDWGQSNVTGHWTLLISYTKQSATDFQWVTNTGLDMSLMEESIGGKLDLDAEDPFMAEPDSILPRIPGSVYGENRVTAPLKDHLYKQLAMAFGISRCGIPDPISSIARFWNRYPFGGGWVFTRPGYTFEELIDGYRRPSDSHDVFVVGTDFSARDTTGWAEGALWTVERVMELYFQVQPVAPVIGK